MQHKDRIEDTDVLIIGAGIVGCSAALMIGQNVDRSYHFSKTKTYEMSFSGVEYE